MFGVIGDRSGAAGADSFLGYGAQLNKPNSNNKLCRNGVTCSMVGSGCPFSHVKINKPCRLGNKCDRAEKCLFQHGSANRLSGANNQEMLLWLRAKNGEGRAC